MPPSSMRSHGRAAGSAGCLDDGPCTGPAAAGAGLPPGGGAGACVWLSAAPASPAHGAERWNFSLGGGLGMAVPGPRRVPGRFAAGAFGGAGCRGRGLGNDGGKAFAPSVSFILALCSPHQGANFNALQKNFAFLENFVCIWTKMGYNKVE